MAEKGTPFGRSLPVQAIIGSNPPGREGGEGGVGTQLQGPEVQMKMTGHLTITQSRSERVNGLRAIFVYRF